MGSSQDVTQTQTAKTKQSIPIQAPATGLLRIYSIQRNLVIGVIEECLHPTFLDGMCVVCGIPRSSLKGGKNTSPTATNSNIGNEELLSQVTVSGGITMTVSQQESRNMALLDSSRLFGQKRLSLVLDLDHTLVHATSDGRARKYLSPTHDVRTISLADPQHARMAQHYVKLRPHVKEFLAGQRIM